jgi:hypothetical protein
MGLKVARCEMRDLFDCFLPMLRSQVQDLKCVANGVTLFCISALEISF